MTYLKYYEIHNLKFNIICVKMKSNLYRHVYLPQKLKLVVSELIYTSYLFLLWSKKSLICIGFYIPVR